MATLRKRGKRWQAQVRRAGANESATFDTKTAAERWARRIEGEIDQGAALGRSRVSGTVSDLLTAYEREIRKAKPIGRSKLGVLGQLRTGLGALPLRQLTTDAILEHCRNRRDKGAGPVTVGLDISLLGTVVRSAQALTGQRVSDQPVRDARTALRPAGMVGKSRERDRIATQQEIDRLCAHWDADPRRKLPLPDFIRFAAITGMRREEIAKLQWADLDAKAGIVIVRDRKDPRRKQGNDQAIPLLFGSLAIALRQPRTSDRIFPVKADSISTLFARACSHKDVGIVGLRFHDLRHTAITRMFSAGMKLEQVAVISGHRSWEMLRRYTHLRAEDLVRLFGAPEPQATPPDSDDDTEPTDLI